MDDELTRGLKALNYKDRLLVLKMQGINAEHLKIAARDVHPAVRERALAHHLADKSVFDSTLDDPHGQVVPYILTKYPDKVNGDWITRAWNHPSIDRNTIAPIVANLPNTPVAVKQGINPLPPPVVKSISLEDLDLLTDADCDDGEEVDVDIDPMEVLRNSVYR
jgi:hypothetical protein